MDFLSLISAVPSLMADFSGSTSDPYAEDKKKLAQRMESISAAQGDVNNPLYKQIYGQYQDQNRQNLAQTIAEAQAQNRMNTSMGRTPLFDPSRGGEQMFRALMQGQQGLGAQSDQQTRQALQGMSTGAGNAGTFYNNITPGAARANAQGIHGFTQIEDLLRGATQPQTQQPSLSQPAAATPTPYGMAMSGQQPWVYDSPYKQFTGSN